MSWRDRAPAMLTGGMPGPRGEYCPTPLDRRWLWRLLSELDVRAPLESPLRRLVDDLREYLWETCEHHWSTYTPYGPDDWLGAHRQCLWCNEVEWLDDPPATAEE